MINMRPQRNTEWITGYDTTFEYLDYSHDFYSIIIAIFQLRYIFRLLQKICIDTRQRNFKKEK